MDHIVRARVVVSGVVQGVFFRGSAVDEARRLGLNGWVRNEPDGSVQAIFEGPENEVREAVEWMSHGPSSAIVEDIQIAWEEPRGEPGFHMAH
jgi:acylphosphatase